MRRCTTTLLMIAAVARCSNALACSMPVREHHILASHPPVKAEAGTVTVKIAISEVRIPAKFAKTRYPLERDWMGVRGHRVADGTNKASSELMEVTGRISPACFYPGASYQVSPDGQLIVWITGQQKPRNLMTLLLTPIRQDHDIEDGVWLSVRWSFDKDASTVTLPSPLKPGMIRP